MRVNKVHMILSEKKIKLKLKARNIHKNQLKSSFNKM